MAAAVPIKLKLFVDSGIQSIAVLAVTAFCNFIEGELEVLVDSSSEFQSVQPPRVPYLQTNDAGNILEPKSIIRYLAKRKKPSAALLGESVENIALVEEWLSVYTAHLTGGVAPPAHVLVRLDAHLSSTVFFVGSRITAADCVLYAALHATVAKMPAATRVIYGNIVRWLDHIQYLPQMTPLHTIQPTPPLPLLDLTPPPSSIYSFNFAALDIPAPAKDKKPVAAAAPAKVDARLGGGKESKDGKPAVPAAGAAATPAAAATAPEKKEKAPVAAAPVKAGKAAAAAPAKAPAAAAAGGEKKTKYMCDRMDIRVGRVVTAGPHPTDAAKYVETIDIGGAAPRSVISGVAAHIPLTAFATGNLVTVWVNIKAADMAGIKSEAIVLVGTDAEGKKQLVLPPAGAKVGEKITFPGGPTGTADEEVSSKNISAIKKDLRTGANGVAQYADLVFTTSAGPCVAAGIANGVVA